MKFTNAGVAMDLYGFTINFPRGLELLPSLRIGEAIVVGEAINIPSRVRIEFVEPKPSSNDPKLVKAWLKKFEPEANAYKEVVKAIREQKPIIKKEYRYRRLGRDLLILPNGR